jgi:hypothetical protein
MDFVHHLGLKKNNKETKYEEINKTVCFGDRIISCPQAK